MAEQDNAQRVVDPPYDLLIVGAGINGAAIARDAVGRGLSVLLCDQGDIGGATSSASSKLIHGGLRYLEHYEFRLVAEALAEREVLLKIAPHLTRPLRFVMPQVAALRPAWMLRLGLLLYDGLGKLGSRVTLPGAASVDLAASPLGAPLRAEFRRGYTYSDVSADDARLTLLTALDAAERGAAVLPRTRFLAARRQSGRWLAQLQDLGSGSELTISARALVNAAGPWVAELLSRLPAGIKRDRVKLVKGSHIVVPRLYAGEHAYILQNPDKRVIFLLPFEQEFTLIGTTDIGVTQADAATATAPEIDYLCAAASRFLREPLRPDDVVWHYSGVRALHDDGHSDPAALTRDYTLILDTQLQAPALSVFGGKLTTHRKLAEAALARLGPWFAAMAPPWTATQALPGGDFADREELLAALRQEHPQLPRDWLQCLVRRHGSRATRVIGDARSVADLGRDFGGGLYEREVAHFISVEWAQSSDDILWRRSKVGLFMSPAQRAALAVWLKSCRIAGPAPSLRRPAPQAQFDATATAPRA